MEQNLVLFLDKESFSYGEDPAFFSRENMDKILELASKEFLKSNRIQDLALARHILTSSNDDGLINFAISVVNEADYAIRQAIVDLFGEEKAEALCYDDKPLALEVSPRSY